MLTSKHTSKSMKVHRCVSNGAEISEANRIYLRHAEHTYESREMSPENRQSQEGSYGGSSLQFAAQSRKRRSARLHQKKQASVPPGSELSGLWKEQCKAKLQNHVFWDQTVSKQHSRTGQDWVGSHNYTNGCNLLCHSAKRTCILMLPLPS